MEGGENLIKISKNNLYKLILQIFKAPWAKVNLEFKYKNVNLESNSFEEADLGFRQMAITKKLDFLLIF